MKYISEEKLQTYLKLKKELVLFIGTGRYFESKTFDWIKLEYHSDTIKCSEINSFDEGDESFNDVRAFKTAGSLEKEIGSVTERFIEGTFDECLQWIKKNYTANTDQFVVMEDLNEIYSGLVKNGSLGN